MYPYHVPMHVHLVCMCMWYVVCVHHVYHTYMVYVVYTYHGIRVPMQYVGDVPHA